MAYRDYIARKKAAWIGRKVEFEGKQYTVVDVDYNGSLMIDKPSQFNTTTAVDTYMVKQID